MDTMFLLLTNSDSIYKQIVLWKKANRIEILLNIMKGNVFMFYLVQRRVIKQLLVILFLLYIHKIPGFRRILFTFTQYIYVYPVLKIIQRTNSVCIKIELGDKIVSV